MSNSDILSGKPTPPDSLNGIKIPYSASIGQLQKIINDDAIECWAAYVALGYKKDPAAADFLIQQLSSKNWAHRGMAAECLRLNEFGNKGCAALIRLLKNPVGSVVRRACDSLTSFHCMEAHSAIYALLQSNDLRTKQVVLRSLCTIWNENDFEAVLHIAAKDADDRTRKEASWTLRHHASSENWKDLFAIWSIDPTPRHRIWACEVIASFGQQRDLSKLESLLGDTDGHVRDAATKARSKLVG